MGFLTRKAPSQLPGRCLVKLSIILEPSPLSPMTHLHTVRGYAHCHKP